MTSYMTYELYLEGQESQPTFQAVTCRDEGELLSLVQRMIADQGLKAIEVRRLGAHLFTLTA